VSERAPLGPFLQFAPLIPQISIRSRSPLLPAPAMRIRRRPQAQALIPSPLPSDPSQPPNAPGNQPHWLPQKEEDYKPEEELHSRRPNVDLGGEHSPSPPARRALVMPPHPPQVRTVAHSTFQY
jgi:hypothetical protein